MGQQGVSIRNSCECSLNHLLKESDLPLNQDKKLEKEPRELPKKKQVRAGERLQKSYHALTLEGQILQGMSTGNFYGGGDWGAVSYPNDAKEVTKIS